MPLPIFLSVTSSPAEGLLVVLFWTTPFNVSAVAPSEQTKSNKIMASCFNGWAPSGFCRLQHFDFGQYASCFCFQTGTHAVIVGLGEFAGLEFKIQVTQVFIDYFFALVKVGYAGLYHAGVSVTRGKKNIDQHTRGKQAAHHLDHVVKYRRTHISVSRRARSRNASRSGARFRSAAATGAGRIFHLRITNTTASSPSPRPAAGSIQAKSSKPCVEGSTTAVMPQLVRNQFSTSSSLPVFLTCSLNCPIIWAELGQPTWLHFSSICAQLHVHMILPPRFWNRASWLSAPISSTNASESSSDLRILFTCPLPRAACPAFPCSPRQ